MLEGRASRVVSLTGEWSSVYLLWEILWQPFNTSLSLVSITIMGCDGGIPVLFRAELTRSRCPFWQQNFFADFQRVAGKCRRRRCQLSKRWDSLVTSRGPAPTASPRKAVRQHRLRDTGPTCAPMGLQQGSTAHDAKAGRNLCVVMDDDQAWDVKNVNSLMSFAFVIPANSKLSTLRSDFFPSPKAFSKEYKERKTFPYSSYKNYS